ncbi:MAG: hypothetical protein DRI57_31865 [Deltaproteobacteria bacterium]|nr:MAG: hypothetical protein DRI57_31865 [Deltaproteobacteria bacterium]
MNPHSAKTEKTLNFRQYWEQVRRIIVRHFKIQLSNIETRPVRYCKMERVELFTMTFHCREMKDNK